MPHDITYRLMHNNVVKGEGGGKVITITAKDREDGRLEKSVWIDGVGGKGYIGRVKV